MPPDARRGGNAPLPPPPRRLEIDGEGAQVDQLDARGSSDREGFFVAVELAVVDPADAGVGDQLEAGPARARRRVELGARHRDTVLGRLNDRVGFGMDGGDTVSVLDD